jgi:hypothetical protein
VREKEREREREGERENERERKRERGWERDPLPQSPPLSHKIATFTTGTYTTNENMGDSHLFARTIFRRRYNASSLLYRARTRRRSGSMRSVARAASPPSPR